MTRHANNGAASAREQDKAKARRRRATVARDKRRAGVRS